MRFKIDENLPREAVELFQDAGYDAMSVADQGLHGKPDDVVFDVCAVEERTVVTLDLDFADLRWISTVARGGFIVLRIPRQDRDMVLQVLERVVALCARENPTGFLWIVEPHRVRIRRLAQESP